MLIKLVEQHEKTEDEKVENIYEEIIPREKKVGRSNSSSSQSVKVEENRWSCTSLQAGTWRRI